MFSFVAALSICTICVVNGYPQGPPTSACSDMYPTGHGANAQTGTPYFQITVDQSTYSADGTVTVNLIATSNYYEGVFIQARRATSNCSDGTNDTPVGTFTIPSGDTFLQLMTCSGVSGSAVSQKTKVHITNKSITWTAPNPAIGQIYFRGTFVKNEKTFWTDISSPIVKPTGDSTTSLSACPVRTTMADNGSGRLYKPVSLVILLSTIVTVLSRGV
ncbi:hypothetical protein SNE40_007382 [Patella caerulea]|uniref:Reelin domain-containing protein n=1 Tax=Patella caerulea TaxID=87958 RepID=A0AAN8JXJ9_PATCE